MALEKERLMRSAAQVQKDINRALKESNGAWTGRLSALVTERMAAREAERGGSIPRQTTIMGEPHRLAYINPVEERVLKDMGGSGAPVGPGGVPAFFLGTASGNWGMGTGTATFDTPAGTKTVSTTNVGPNKTVEVKTTAELRAEKEAKDAAAAKAAQDRVNEILAQQNDRDDRAPAGTYTGTGVTLGGGTTSGGSAGTSQSTGPVAGETALERRRRLTVERNQELAAQREAEEAAALAAWQEAKRLKDLEEAAAAAEAQRKKAEAEAAAVAAAEKKRLEDQAAAAAAAEARRKKAEAEAAAVKAAEEAAAKAAADAAAASAIDFTTTATGRPYGEVASTEQAAVSGAEAALDTFAGGTQDTGVTEGDFPIYEGSFGEDFGVTPGYSFNPETGSVEPNPVVDLGGINISPESGYSSDPYAESLQSWFDEMGATPSGPVVDPVAEALARERAAAEAAAEAARTRAQLEALDAMRRTTGVQPGLTSAAIDPFAATPLGPIGNIMNVGYGEGQVDPRLAAAANRSNISEEEFQRAVANYQPDKGLGVLATAGVPLTLELLGTAAQGLGSIITEPLAGVGYGEGQVDPRLAAAVAGGAPGEISYVPSNLTNPLVEFGREMAGAGDVLGNRALGNAPRLARENLAADIWTTDEQGNTVYNNDALVAKLAYSAVPTAAGLGGGVAGLPGYVATASLLGAGEVALQSKDQVEAYARSKGIDPAMAKAMGDEAVRLGTMYGLPMEMVSNALFSPFGSGNLLGNAAKNAVEEFFTEGALEQTLSNVAALQATGQNVLEQPYYGGAFDLNEGTVGAVLGGGISLLGGGTQTTPSVQPVPPSVLQPAPPFIPAAPSPGFTPGPGAAATMTVEGTATDVTPGFRPTGPTVGQIAQTPPGLLTAYEQAADTMREAGVRGVGGTPATMLDVAAATEIINNEIAETGGLSQETALNLERATGLSATTIKDIAETAPRVGTPRDTLITDVVTGTGGGGQIQVTTNPNGTYTLRNLTTGNPQHVATVEPGQNLDEAIKVFDEVTTVGSPAAIQVDTAGTATLPPAQLTREPAPYTSPAAEPTTALVPTGPTGIATLPSVGGGTQLGTAQPVDLTADSSTTAEVIEFTPTEDVIEGTAVEIAGQIPGTVATTTTPITTTAVSTVPAASTAVSTVAEDIEEPPEDLPTPEIEEGPGDVDEEPETEVTIEEAVEEEEESTEEPPFECPDGYTAVKLAGRWTCQKTETTQVGRPTIGTRPYLSEVGFAGPSPYRPSIRTRTRTVTAAE